MSFSSRRRNYLLTPHRRDGLVEWMKSMLQHSFVLDVLETTAADTFSHFELLIEEHRELESNFVGTGIFVGGAPNISRHGRTNSVDTPTQQSRLRQLVPTIGSFHTHLPLREAFDIYNEKHQLTKRKHIQISFNELRHILNLAQIIALHRNGRLVNQELNTPDNTMESMIHSISNIQSSGVGETSAQGSARKLAGPRIITFDGDQTLYRDGANFDSNPRLAFYIYQLLRHQVVVAIVTAAGYEYNVEKYEYRISGLLHFFKQQGLTETECESFYLFGGECNFLFQLGSDYTLHPVRESGPGGWCTATQYLSESPANWPEYKIQNLLDVVEQTFNQAVEDYKLRGRVIRKKRSVGLAPLPGKEITRESLDETVLRVNEELHNMNHGTGPGLPYCAFNGGTDAWVDVGNKRVGVQVLQAYLGIPMAESLHIGDQFLKSGNDYAARDVSPCVWIISPQETTYVLKSILRLSGVGINLPEQSSSSGEVSVSVDDSSDENVSLLDRKPSVIDFAEMDRRTQTLKGMDVYTGNFITQSSGK